MKKSIFLIFAAILCAIGVNAATQRYIYVGISNNYYQYKDNSQYGFNFWGGTSPGVKSGTYLAEYTWDGRTYYMYRVQVYDDNNKAQFKGNNNWWDPGDGFSVTLNGTKNNAVFFSHTNDGWGGQFQQDYQETSKASLSASNTSVTKGTNVTLTPSLSSNSTYNTIKSTSYSITPNSGASISGNTFTATKAGDYTVTATVTYNPEHFTDITKTATAQVKITVTEPTYAVTIKSNDDNQGTVSPSGSNQIGVSGITVTANPKTGYKFASWSTTGGASATNQTAKTTITATAEGTATAHFEEDLSTGWYIAGEFSNKGDKDTGWNTDKIEFKKLSGESSGTVSYITLDLLPTTFTDDYNMSFKLVNGDWYGNDGEYKKANDKQDWQFETGKGNCNLDVSLPGTYTFCLNTNKDGKVYLNIAYPIVNLLQIYTANPSHPYAVANWEWDTQSANESSKTLTLNENTTYTFKVISSSEFYGKSTTLTRSKSSDELNTAGGDVTMKTDIAGDYTFTWNLTDKKLTVAYPPLPKHKVTATVNPAESGTVTGTDEYEQGSEATLIATPAAGYTFKNWTVAGSGTEKSVEAKYTFTVAEPIDLVANFVPEVTHEVTVSYLCNGTPIPGQTETKLAVGVTTPSTVSAPAITNYKFDSWTLGSGVQAEDDTKNPIQITTLATGAYTLAANYTKIELTYTVEVPAGTPACYIAGEMNSWTLTEMTKVDDTHYTITIEGATTAHKYKYACGDSWDHVELKADGSSVDNRTYNANDIVEKWADPLSTNVFLAGDMTNKDNWDVNKKEFRKATADATTASVTVTLAAQTYKFKLVVGGAWKGNTGTMKRGGESVHEGGWSFDKDGYDDNCKIIADVAGDYTFTWDLVSEKLTVIYPVVYTITASAENGTVEGAGTYVEGTSVTLTATANEGYKFVNWTKEGEEVSTDATYTFTATENVTLTANFELKSYTITATAENGTVEGAGVYNHGATVTLTATANEGYKFVNWTKGGEIVSTDATYIFTATENVDLVANFKATTITLTTGNNDAIIAANIGNTVDVVIERNFTANDGYYTLCVPFNMPASVIGKAYSLGIITEHVAGEGININLKEENELSAGMPYLVLPKEDMTQLVVENVTIQPDHAAGQGVGGSQELNVQIFFQGYYSAPGVTTNGTTQYYVGNNGYLYNGKVEIRGLSGLFTITDTEGNPANVRARVVAGENVETGVEDIITTDAPVKVIENGQLIIIRGGVKYNVQGQRL